MKKLAVDLRSITLLTMTSSKYKNAQETYIISL